MNVTKVNNLQSAIVLLREKIEERGLSISKVENLSSQGKYGNARIYTTTGEIYHLKFTKTGYKPKDSSQVSEAAKELDEKLKFAIRQFGNGDETINGIDIDLLLILLDEASNGKACYFTTIIGDGTTLWCSAEEFYNFVMRYDTFFKFPRSNVPVCEVPMGWLLKWDSPIVAYPKLSEGEL